MPTHRSGALLPTCLCWLLLNACSSASRPDVRRFPVVQGVSHGAATGALSFACAEDPERLAAYFRGRQLRFQPNLLRTLHGLRCHIEFKPSLPGFRAAPDDAPPTELTFAVDTVSALADNPTAAGSSFHLATALLANLATPARFRFIVTATPPGFEQHLAATGKPRGHTIQLVTAPSATSHPWPQDYLKAGYHHGQPRYLVPYRSFEGRRSMALESEPLLEAIATERNVRSQLAWEGGDLQFASDPHRPGRLVLYYGTTAKRYWASALNMREFEYVLLQEFGADAAYYLGDLTPHVDYLVSFLPRQRAVLVADAVCGNLALAREAMNQLARLYEGGAPPRIRALQDALRAGLPQAAPLLADAEQAIRQQPVANRTLSPDVNRLIHNRCPTSPDACLQPPLLTTLLAAHAGALRQWSNDAAIQESARLLPGRLLQLIRSQVEPCDADWVRRLDMAADLFRARGYAVVRAPYPGVLPSVPNSWPGLSYVNNLVMGDQIWLPAFGLGAVEQEWFRRIAAQLPAYRLQPLPARRLMLANGGLHCAAAIGRALSVLK